MRIDFNLWPNGLKHALTMSYDDGQKFDLRLSQLFDENGIRGTFHLNTRMYTEGDKDNMFLSADEVKALSKRHEISMHMHTHPFPTKIPLPIVADETIENKRILEGIAGYPVRGMSYPYGDYNDEVITLLRGLGVEYSRTTQATGGFDVPEDFMKWHPTCHHNGFNGESINDIWERFMHDRYTFGKLRLFYLWGHSFEFNGANNWNVIESFCELAGGRDDVWYATNIEIVDYVNAIKSLKFSQDRHLIQNVSPLDVYVSVDGEPVCLKANAVTRV